MFVWSPWRKVICTLVSSYFMLFKVLCVPHHEGLCLISNKSSGECVVCAWWLFEGPSHIHIHTQTQTHGTCYNMAKSKVNKGQPKQVPRLISNSIAQRDIVKDCVNNGKNNVVRETTRGRGSEEQVRSGFEMLHEMCFCWKSMHEPSRICHHKIQLSLKGDPCPSPNEALFHWNARKT